MRIQSVLLAASLTLTGLFGQAQTAKTQKATKPPALRSVLGMLQGNANTTRENAVAAIKLPLKVFEIKTNKELTISSYQVLYRQKTLAEDENGKLTPSGVVTAQLFKSTPLPELWITELSSRLQPGEELKFFDIIAKDEKGRVMYAPDMNISIR